MIILTDIEESLSSGFTAHCTLAVSECTLTVFPAAGEASEGDAEEEEADSHGSRRTRVQDEPNGAGRN